MSNLEFLTGKLTPEEPGYDQVLDVLATRLLLCVVFVRLLAYRRVNQESKKIQYWPDAQWQ